jgi:hypothetical protein
MIDEFFVVAGRKWRRDIPCMRARRKIKTVDIEWNEGGCDYHEFAAALDCEAMHAELLAIWKRCKPQCDRRASFSHGSVGSYLGYVPHEAGIEAMQVIRRYYAAALDTLQRRESAT